MRACPKVRPFQSELFVLFREDIQLPNLFARESSLYLFSPGRLFFVELV